MSRDHIFLLDCLRHFLWPEVSLDISNLDWAAVLALAKEHSVAPIVYSTLHDTFAETLAPPVLDELRESFRQTARANLLMSSELVRLLLLFDRAEIEVLPLKGPVLAESLYNNLALRAYSDLDLLIRPRDLLRAKRLLESSGYALTSALHWHSDSACFRARECQLSFAHTRGTSVDVHWQLFPDYFPEALDADRVWSARRAVAFAGTTTWTLSREHLVLFLCAHGAKHLWERLIWICDLARLLQVETEMDWPYVFAEANRTGTSRMLSLGLLLASDLLPYGLPEAASNHVSTQPAASKLASQVRERFLSNLSIPAPAIEAARFSVRAFERTSHRFRYLFGSFLGPSEAEYRALSLPPVLHGMYYLFRPMRLAARSARRVAGFKM